MLHPRLFNEIFLLFILGLFSGSIYSQDCNHLVTHLNRSSTNPTYNSYEIPESFLVEQADSLIITARCNDFIQVRSNNISRTLAESRNYYFFKVQNSLSENDFIIEIENSHNNLVGLYSKEDGSNWKSTYLSGDHINHNQRNYDHRSIIFPVHFAENQVREFIVMIDMVNSSYALPIRIWEKEAFHISDYKKNLVFGAYLGFVGLVMIFVIFAYLLLQRKVLFFYYMVYLLCTTLFVLSDLGLGDQFIWPNAHFLDEPLTFIAIFGSTSFFLLFASELLDVRRLSKALIFLRNLFLVLVVIELSLLLSPLISNPKIFVFFFDFALYLIFSGMMLALIFGIIALIKRKPLALYFLIAFGAYIVGSALKPLFLKEVIPYSFSAQYGVLIGHSFEITILSLVLVYQAWSTIKEKQKLTEELSEKEKESYQLLAKGEYSERKRLASVIHDGISPKLAFLTMRLSSKVTGSSVQLDEKEVEEIIDDIREVSKELRNLSRSISPIELSQKGLKNAVQDLVNKYAISSGKKIDFQYSESKGGDIALLRIKEEAMFFTINELLLNVILHNNPSHIRVQMKMNVPECRLTVTDDGFPIPASVITEGIGMKNIESRAAVHNGSFVQSRDLNLNKQIFTISSL